jgi:shikimate kinase
MIASSCAENMVLATGGGAVLSEENRQVLRSHGTVVYLRAASRPVEAHAA